MPVKTLLTVAALFVVGCSGTTDQSEDSRCAARRVGAAGSAGTAAVGDSTGDQRLIVPDGLSVTPRIGINSAFNVVALTLRAESGNAELYAAVRNDGDGAPCNASFSVELRDENDQILATGISGILVQHFYALRSDPTSIAGCVPAGETAMVALPNMPLDVPLTDVRSVVYQSSYWGLDIVPVDGVGLSGVSAVARGTGVAYTGELINGLDTPLTHPTVAIFPVNAVGRPLGVAYGGATLEVPKCGTWNFETNAVSDPGVGFEAFPMGGP